MSEKEPDLQYIEKPNPIDDIESTHFQRIAMAELADPERWPLERLKEQAYYWTQESGNKLRSMRSRKECMLISRMMTFEYAYRTDDMDRFIKIYSGEAQ